MYFLKQITATHAQSLSKYFCKGISSLPPPRCHKKLKIGGIVEDLKAYQLIPLTRPFLAILHTSTFNPFLFIKNKRLFISSEVSPLQRPNMLSECNAAHPVGCDSTLKIEMAVWRPFCLNSYFLGRVWQPSANNKGAPKGHYYLQRATPDEITQQNSLRWVGAP